MVIPAPVTTTTTVTTTTPTAARTKKVATSRRKPQPIVDNGDMFDIYSFDYLENEFGTLSDVNPYLDEPPKQQLNIPTNEGFDFVEACQSLKEDILRPSNPETDGEDDEVHQSDIPEFETPPDGSDRSDDYVDVNDSMRQLDVESTTIKSEDDTILSVVTASREPFLWIWNLNSGAALEKISFKSSQKSSDVKFQGECQMTDLIY